MKKEIISSILINAHPTKVWKELTNFESYPDWNPFIIKAKGDIIEGGKLNITTKPVGSKPFSFTPRVKKIVKNKSIIWFGKALIRGVFDGQHCFELYDNQDGTTTFIQKETFSGILIPFCKKIIEVDTLQGFKLMNEALKARVENRSIKVKP